MTSWSIQRAAGPHGIDPDLRAGISVLVDEAEGTDGVAALDDQVRLDLQHPPGKAIHLVAVEDGHVVGYAHVDLRAPDSTSGHLVVAPSRRRAGIGRSLVATMIEVSEPQPLSIWAHGNSAGAQAFAAALTWRPVRDLRQLILPVSTAIAEAHYPDGVTVRTFETGRDEAAWVDVNAAAFVHHREQGRMTVEDMVQREEQPWFDPAGLFLAERDGVLLGSHWTKIHQHDDESRVGEVYVVGVSPDAQGLGLGKALTLTGLQYLRDRGLDVILYVDGENTAAVALYERIGFTTKQVDVMYSPA